MTTFWAILAFLKSEVALRLVTAVICGALIGVEREWLHKPAGVRTCALICLGSALFSVVGVIAGAQFDSSVLDVTRIASNVVQGVGFLGAGAIIFFKDKVVGLTTAAVVWLVAAVGIALGFGLYPVGIFVTLLSIAVLTFVGVVEKKLSKRKRRQTWKRSLR